MVSYQIRFDDGAAYERYMGKWSRLAGEKLGWHIGISPIHYVDERELKRRPREAQTRNGIIYAYKFNARKAPNNMALEIRPNCECCDRDLAPDSKEAFICTFECTYCRDCASSKLNFVCANCGGELVRRPIRPAARLIGSPASGKRVLRAGPCVAHAG